jgi:16S rRNA processing protein RimM
MENKEFVILGKVEDAFGNEGKLKVRIFAPQRLWEGLKEVYLKKKGGDLLPFEVEHLEVRGKKAYLKLKGVDSADDALKMVGAHIYYPQEKLPQLKTGEYYYFQLVGAQVVDKEGNPLGRVQYIHDGVAYPMLVLEDERIIPFTKNFVLEVDTDKKRIVVDGEKLP